MGLQINHLQMQLIIALIPLNNQTQPITLRIAQIALLIVQTQLVHHLAARALRGA